MSAALPEAHGGELWTAMPRAPEMTRQVSTGSWTDGFITLAPRHCSSRKSASIPKTSAKDGEGR